MAGKKKACLALIVVFAILLGTTASAWALTYKVGVVEGNGTSTYYSLGTNGYLTAYSSTMPSSAAAPNAHVQSIFVYWKPTTGSPLNMVEVGWSQGWYQGTYPGGPFGPHPTPNHFWALAIQYNGTSGGYWAQDICPDGLGETHQYRLDYGGAVGGGQYRWCYFVDTNNVANLNAQLPYGFSVVGCERNTLNTVNSGTFWNMYRKSLSSVWQIYVGPREFMDNDPNYDLRMDISPHPYQFYISR